MLPMADTRASGGWLERSALIAVRYGLPGALLVAGTALVLLDLDDATVGLGVGLALAALVVFLLNVLMRAGISSQADRDREEAARAYFDRHGRWPEKGRHRPEGERH